MEMSHEMWIIRTVAKMLDVQKVSGTLRYQRRAINTHNYVQTAQKSWCVLFKMAGALVTFLCLSWFFAIFFLSHPFSPCYPLLSLYS